MRLTPARKLVLNLFKTKSSLLCAEDIERLLKMNLFFFQQSIVL